MDVILIKREGVNAFFWNTEANVGLNSPNKLLDVQLVQFGYFALSQSKLTVIHPSLKTAAAKVVPGAAYKATLDDPLTIAIITHQKVRGGTQDGHVSRINNASGGYLAGDGPHTFMLAVLNNNMRDLLGQNYPRLDKHGKCPGELKKAIDLFFLT